MTISVSDAACDALEPPHSRAPDPRYNAWLAQLATLSVSEVVIRQAQQTPLEGLRLRDLQVKCEPITVQLIRKNFALIGERGVLLAEIDGVHVGFCVFHAGPRTSDPLFIQQVGVVPAAQRKGVGLALLTAAAKRDPLRNIAMATQDENAEARALNTRFAESIGASIERVNRGVFRDRYLGITRGDGYRAWFIQRPQVDSKCQ